MTDNKLTDEQIIKALETHIELRKKEICTPETPLELLKLILDLSNRQKAEIERLKLKNGLLESERELHKIGASKLVLKHKSEARKELAERVKEISYLPNMSITGQYVVDVEDIDTLLKEMDGE